MGVMSKFANVSAGLADKMSMAAIGIRRTTLMPRSTKRNSAKMQSDAEERHQPQARKLMSVALELFARRGFSSVTIKDIAKSANVNSALLYYYFDSKEDLFKSS